MASNYDNSAWFYDRLSRVVYGRALIRAQVYLLQYIPAGSKVLIIGGGTGWILEEIAKIHPSGLKITYVEISANMIALSHKRNAGENEVTFINKAAEQISFDTDFDVVITAFLFDNFTEEGMQKIFTHIDKSLKPGRLWLNSDFKLTGKWWQHILLRSMLTFFRIICRIESSKLPDIESCFQKHGYSIIEQKPFFGEFILSTAYSKT